MYGHPAGVLWPANRAARQRGVATDPAWLANPAADQRGVATDPVWPANPAAGQRGVATDPVRPANPAAGQRGVVVGAAWPANPAAGQRGVVVGAASGIGRAVATALAPIADELLIVDRDESISSVAQELGCHALRLDVADAGTPQRLGSYVEDRWGAPNFLINCAGIQRRGTTLGLPEPDWFALFETNFHGIRRLTHPLVQAMCRHQVAGCVVNVSSSSVDSVTPGIIPYSTAKAALAQWTRGLAAEVGPKGVRVNAVAPGYIATPMIEARLADTAFRARVEARIRLGGIGQPEDVVGPILFLISDAARYVTGAVVPVDGGYFLGT